MRDGDWKLVRPPIPQTIYDDPADAEMDRALKYEPGKYTDICRDPLPQREIPSPPPQLFNLADDPIEQNELSSESPQRVRRMLEELGKWFGDVEGERKGINDQE